MTQGDRWDTTPRRTASGVAGLKARFERDQRSFAMAMKIAWRNLVYDPTSLAVTLTGIVFSVVLLAAQCGLYLGSERMISAVQDNVRADLWIVPSGTECFDDVSLMEGRERYGIMAVKGVASTEELVVGYGLWRRPTGGSAAVLVVGTDPKGRRPLPWNVIAGHRRSLAAPSAVSVDKTYMGELGVKRLGNLAEINNARVRVASISDGIRSFTTVPYVFTSAHKARELLFAGRDQATYILVNVRKGARIEKVKADLQKHLPDLEVLTHDEFRQRGVDYWLFETGAGSALISGAVLGLIVGLVIVAQTLYSSTKDHLKEFATLRALGASSHYIHRIIVGQAVISAFLGYGIGMILSLLIVWASQFTSLFIIMTPGLAFLLFVLTFGMCVLAAFSAILKITRIDPASVFSGG